MPTVGNVKVFLRLASLRLYLAAAIGLLTPTAPFSGGAAGLHATREVVASEHDLEVVGDEGAHETVGAADLVLRLVRLHHGEVSLRNLRKY